MQARSSRFRTRRTPTHPVLQAASYAALALVLGSAVVVFAVGIATDLTAARALARPADGRVTPQQVRRLKAEGMALRDEVEDLAQQWTVPGRSLHASRPGALLVRALYAVRAALDPVLKLEAAVRRGDDFLARHLRNEVHREYDDVRSLLSMAKQQRVQR